MGRLAASVFPAFYNASFPAMICAEPAQIRAMTDTPKVAYNRGKVAGRKPPLTYADIPRETRHGEQSGPLLPHAGLAQTVRSLSAVSGVGRDRSGRTGPHGVVRQ